MERDLSRHTALLFSGLILFVSCTFAAARRPAAHNKSVSYQPRVEKLLDRYRLTLQSSEPLAHSLIEKNKKKIWLRLARPSSEGSLILEGDSVIREVRLVSRPYSADMILNLGGDAVSSDVYFDDGKRKLVVDIFTSKYVQPEAQPRPVVLITQKAKLAEEKPLKKQWVAKSGKILTVVIDAGHGGMDSGAIGTRGTLEKDINLDFAEDLAHYLSKEKNVRVVMTRSRDEFIPLNQRTEIANSAHADLFVSIHCNSSFSSNHTGFETYFLSPDATDKAAESVARLENSVVALERKKGESPSRLNELLASMAVGNFINESSKFASLVCRNIRTRTSQDRTEAKEADFYVLRGAQMPAVLIELEYLSNPVSELRLRSSRYRSQMVKAVTEGIKAYDQQARQEREAMALQPRQTLVSSPQ